MYGRSCRGDVLLCASCDGQRSTLGKGQRSTLGKGQPRPGCPLTAPVSLLDW